MISIKDEQFSIPLAENQPEYTTLHIHVDLEDNMCPATVCFQLSREELAELNANGGKLYYQQCLFRKGFEQENGEIEYQPAYQFHPMNIQVVNPLNK